MRSLLAVLVALTVLATPRDHARASDAQLCAAAIERAEAAASLPPGLLGAVAVSESGKYDRARRGAAPWPWTVNNAGDGRYFASKAGTILPSTYSPQKENICGEIYSVLVQLSLFLSCVHQCSPAMACLHHGWLAGLLLNPGEPASRRRSSTPILAKIEKFMIPK